MSESPKSNEKKWQSFLSITWKSVVVLIFFVLFAVYAAMSPNVPAVILFFGWVILTPLAALHVYILNRIFSNRKKNRLFDEIRKLRPDTTEEIERLLSKAQQNSENQDELLDALYARSLYLYTKGDYTEGLKVARQRVELLRGSHNTLPLAFSLSWLAEVCGRTGDMESAQRHVALALNLLKPNYSQSAESITTYAGALRCQGTLFYQLHKFEAAKDNFSQALSLMMSIEAPEEVIMPFKAALGATFTYLNQFESDQKLLGECLSIAEKHESKDSKLLASIYTRLGRLYTRMGKLDLAENYCDKAISILEANPKEQRGPDSAYYNNAGLLRLAQGRLTEAEELLRKAIQEIKETSGPFHPNLVDMLETLHAVLVAQNRGDEAETISQEKAVIMQKQKMD